MKSVVSRDGTRIAYEQIGQGPLLILVGGAFNDRSGKASGVPLARALSAHFTCIAYDRRGRGESTDTQPYSVGREVEDIAALAEAAGGPFMIYGMSSGAALAIEAAARLRAGALAVYEPPFSVSDEAAAAAKAYDTELRALLARGDNDGAAARFLKQVGMAEPMIAGMRHAPHWPWMARMAPSLAYDAAVLHCDTGAQLPEAALRAIDAPVLALAGEDGQPRLRASAEAVARTCARGTYRELAGQTHDVSVDALAPALVSFFSEL